MAVPYISFVSTTGNNKSAFSEIGVEVMGFEIPVGIDVGEDALINETYVSHPSEQYRFNDTPMIVCFSDNFVLQGNVITVTGNLIDSVDHLHERLRITAST